MGSNKDYSCIVDRAWQKIYGGNVKDMHLKVRQFCEKYTTYIHQGPPVEVPDITAEMVFEAFRSGTKTA